MIVNPADEIKARVSALDVAERYGLPVNKSGFSLCLWHRENSASMRVYPGERGYYCFGCHASGDAISLARKLLGTDYRDTLFILNRDFGLGIELNGRPSPERLKMHVDWMREKQERQQRYEDAESAYMDALDRYVSASGAVDKHRPTSFDGDFGEDFCRALIAREQAEQALEEAEAKWAGIKLRA